MHHVCDLLEGCAVSSNLPRGHQIAPGIPLPTCEAVKPVGEAPEPADEVPELADTPKPETHVFEGEGTTEWIMVADFFEEYALTAEISEVEALEPRNLTEVKHHPDWPLWERAIQEELGVLDAAGTWELVNTPEGANIVGSKWVFHVKKDAAGNVM